MIHISQQFSKFKHLIVSETIGETPMVNNKKTLTKWIPQQMFTPKPKSIETLNCNSIKENQYQVHQS